MIVLAKETGFNRLTKLMLADDLHTYDLWRVPAKAIHYALLGLSCEITELCSEVDRLEAASNANLGGQKPRYGDSNELKEKKRQMRAPLIEWRMAVPLPHDENRADTPYHRAAHPRLSTGLGARQAYAAGPRHL